MIIKSETSPSGWAFETGEPIVLGETLCKYQVVPPNSMELTGLIIKVMPETSEVFIYSLKKSGKPDGSIIVPFNEVKPCTPKPPSK